MVQVRLFVCVCHTKSLDLFNTMHRNDPNNGQTATFTIKSDEKNTKKSTETTRIRVKVRVRELEWTDERTNETVIQTVLRMWNCELVAFAQRSAHIKPYNWIERKSSLKSTNPKLLLPTIKTDAMTNYNRNVKCHSSIIVGHKERFYSFSCSFTKIVLIYYVHTERQRERERETNEHRAT